jgi:hypothetical protein
MHFTTPAERNKRGTSWWNTLTQKTRAEAFKPREGHAGQPQTIVLVIKPAPKPERFLGYIGDELIVTSRQPFLDGARALLARGYDPATPYDMRHANSDVLSFVTTTIGHAAGLSVSDARTPRLNDRKQDCHYKIWNPRKQSYDQPMIKDRLSANEQQRAP